MSANPRPASRQVWRRNRDGRFVLISRIVGPKMQVLASDDEGHPTNPHSFTLALESFTCRFTFVKTMEKTPQTKPKIKRKREWEM